MPSQTDQKGRNQMKRGAKEKGNQVQVPLMSESAISAAT